MWGMFKNPLPLTLMLVAGLFAGSAIAQETIRSEKPKTREGFYGERDEGWFWYKDPAEEKALPPKPPETPPPGAPRKPPPLSAEWLKANLDKYRFAAIDNPTKDNVELYLLLQKLVMDKSEQFALASRAYAAKNPGIDETIQNPTSGISRSSMTQAQEDAQNAVLKKIAQKAGIYYFFRSDCQYCHQQNPMLEILTRMTGLTVLPISLDGLPSQDGLLANWRPDRGQGAYLGVEKTPTMYLVQPGGKVLLLGIGVRAVPDIRTRVIQLAFDERWISKNEYDMAMRGLPRRFLTDGLAETDIADDPAKLLQVLRDASTYGRQEASFTEMDGGGASPWNSRGESSP